MGQLWLDGYSAEIDIYLLVDGRKHDVAQVGGGALVLRNPVAISPGAQATLVLVVDGQEDRTTVILPNGAEPREEEVAYF